MMGEYDSAVALVKKLLKKKGAPSTLRSFVKADPADDTKPWKSGGTTPADQTVNMVWLNYEQKFIDGEFIRAGDQHVYMPSTDTAEVAINPDLTGVILRGSQIWKIIAVEPLNPNGQSIFFEAQVRQ